MNPTSVSFEPIYRLNDLNRLEWVESSQSEEDWSNIHRAVQAYLSTLDADVRSSVPDVLVRAGSTRARVWSLFSYRTYHLSELSGIDAVVVGVTLKPSGGD